MYKKISLFGCLIYHNLFAVPGTLDQTFNPKGPKPGTLVQKIFNFSQINSVAKDSNNKIIAGGYSSNSNNIKYTLARFNTNGSLDQTFNPNANLGPKKGIVVTNIGFGSLINGITITNADKIIAAGTSRANSDPQSLERITLVRYNPNGTLDQTFNPNGERKGVVIQKNWLTSSAQEITQDLNGKIIVVGSTWNNNFGHVMSILRYLKSGILDQTFNPNGEVPGVFSKNIDSQVSRAQAVTIDSHNRIIAAGYSTLGFTVIRCNPNGTLDNTFNGGTGVFTIAIGANNKNLSQVKSVIIDSQNRIYLTGYATVGFTLVRLKENGMIDPTFNPNGIRPGLLVLPFFKPSESWSAKLDSNDKIILTGFSTLKDNLTQVFTLMRINKNATLDRTFNPNGVNPGIVRTKIGPSAKAFTSMLTNNKQKIITAGFAFSSFGLARYFIK